VVVGIQTMERPPTAQPHQQSHSVFRGNHHCLGHRADDIGRIIEVIDDLAEQTNLLALNAIEAARWRTRPGFAADEVRKLAESPPIYLEIADLIQSIQREARQAVENMDRSTRMLKRVSA
jgi:methyl-accepting chemotaxis protein